MPFNRVGAEFRTGIIPRANTPDVAVLDGGGYVVTWVYRSFDGGVVDVLAQRYSDGGEPVGAELMVNSTTVGTREAPDVSSLAGGGFAVTWSDVSPAGTTTVRAQLFNSAGGKVGGELNIATAQSRYPATPELVQLVDGKLVAVWTSDDGSALGVKAQMLDPQGQKIGGEFTINTNTDSDQVVGDVEALGNGNFIVTWTDYSGQSSLSSLNIRAQLLDANGERLGAPFLVNDISSRVQDRSQIAELASGNIAISWVDSSEVVVKVFDPSGAPLSGLIRTSARTDYEISPLSDGGFAVVSNGGTTGIYIQAFTATGQESAAEFKVNTGGTITFAPNVLETHSGDLLVTWGQRNGNTSGSFTIQNQLFQLAPSDPNATANADILIGTVGSDLIDGLNGNDSIIGNDGDDVLIGGTGSNVLLGGAGNDILSISGSGFSGVQGGPGSDTLILNWGDADAAVTVSVSADSQEAGAYQVSAAAYPSVPGEFTNPARSVFASGTEIIWLVAGSAADGITTGDGADVIFGMAGDDVIRAMGGNDFLDGGLGADTLTGGLGNDVYIVDSADDVVVELAGEGTDEIRTTLGVFDLASLPNVEWLTGLGDVTNILTGNSLANRIEAGLGNDQLFGASGDDLLNGGAGTDRSDGGLGNDVHNVDNPGDVVIERAGEGRDTVFASANYWLAEDTEVEVLSASSQAATNPIDLVGNQLDNTIFGNAGNNILTGGAGADFMLGYGGNDIFSVDNAGDFVFENAGEGYDTVFTNVSYVLPLLVEVEAISTTNQAGTALINLAGNEISNVIFGNNGANVLNGGGGNDVLLGYGGADTFAFTTALGSGNVDTIGDFFGADDTVALDDAVFIGLALGALDSSAFSLGSAAGDADDRIVYDSATGQLFFDADGIGAGGAILFTTVQPGTALTANDFIVI